MSKVTLGPDFATFDLLGMHLKIISHLDHSSSFLANKAFLKLHNFNFETAYKSWVHKCSTWTFVYVLKSTKKGLKNDRWGNLLWQMYWLMFSCASQQLAFSSQYYVAFFLVNMYSSWAKQFFYDESLSRNHTNRCSLRNLYAQRE